MPTVKPPEQSDSIGTVMIAVQDALLQVGFRNDQECKEFCQQLCHNAREDIRQRLGTWRNNRAVES